MTKLRSSISMAVFAAGVLVTSSAFGGEHIAYDVSAGTVGNESYSGALGMDFDVVTPINVYALGVYDSGQDGLAAPLVVRIYDRNKNAAPLGQIRFAAGMTGTLVNGSRYLPLPCPISLPAGFQGTIEADGYGATELNGAAGGPARTTNDGGGAISFVGSGRRSSTPGIYPTTIDVGTVDAYAAGTFTFAPACKVDADCTNAAHPSCGANGGCGADSCFQCGPTNACSAVGPGSCNAAHLCVPCTADYYFGSASDDRCSSGRPYCMADGSCSTCPRPEVCAATPGPECQSCSGFGQSPPRSTCNADKDCAAGEICGMTGYGASWEYKTCRPGCRAMVPDGCPSGTRCTGTLAGPGVCESTTPQRRDLNTPGGYGCRARVAPTSDGSTSSYAPIFLLGAFVLGSLRRRKR
jgi:MYXO-CTERM domain-containing protein